MGLSRGVVSGFIRLQGATLGQGDTYWGLHRDFTIGRGADRNVVLDNRSVSREHAEVTLTQHGWLVRDLDSTNGTFVNGQRIGSEGHLLGQGDMLRCGTVVLFVAELIKGLPEDSMTPDEWKFGAT